MQKTTQTGHASARIAERRYWAERERKEAAFMQRRAELRDEIKQERKDVAELIGEAESWQRAKTLRTYIAAVRALAKRKGTLDDYAEWIKWARDQANRIDPLRPSPPSVLDTPRDQYRDLGMNESLNEDGEIEEA